MAAFEKYLDLVPAEPSAHNSMAEYYYNAGDSAKSEEYFKQAAALGGFEPQGRTYRTTIKE